MEQDKISVGLVYGGRSGEHAVSLVSAASVAKHLDQSRFTIFLIGVDREGRWYINDTQQLLQNNPQELPVNSKGAECIYLPVQQALTQQLDVIFPLIHGPFGEDGSLQGLLEMADLPYVGSGVLGSAVAMDKDISKRLFIHADLPVLPYRVIYQEQLSSQKDAVIKMLEADLLYPLFVKPANLGSSVGINKATDHETLERALNEANQYDCKIVVEQGIDAREIEYAVLENPDDRLQPFVSIPGEITVSNEHAFYSYDAKYTDPKGALLHIPAQLSNEQIEEGKTLAKRAFSALECNGMARVDLLLEKKTNTFYLNEVNTIPGFTRISMYPKLWEASGWPYQDLLSRLIDLAIWRYKRANEKKLNMG